MSNIKIVLIMKNRVLYLIIVLFAAFGIARADEPNFRLNESRFDFGVTTIGGTSTRYSTIAYKNLAAQSGETVWTATVTGEYSSYFTCSFNADYSNVQVDFSPTAGFTGLLSDCFLTVTATNGSDSYSQTRPIMLTAFKLNYDSDVDLENIEAGETISKTISINSKNSVVPASAVWSASVSEEYRDYFTVSVNAQRTQVSIDFTPTSAVEHLTNCYLTVSAVGTDGITYTRKAKLVVLPSFSVSESGLDFGRVEVGSDPVTKSFTIENLNSEALSDETTWSFDWEDAVVEPNFSVSKVGNRVDVTFNPQGEAYGSTLNIRATSGSGDAYSVQLYCSAEGFSYDNTMDLYLYMPFTYGPFPEGETSLDDVLTMMGGTLTLPWYDLPSDLMGEFHVKLGSNLASTAVSSSNKNVTAKIYFDTSSIGGSTERKFYVQAFPETVGSYQTTIKVESVVIEGIHAGEKITKSFDLNIVFFYVSLNLSNIDKTSSSLTMQWDTNPYATSYKISISEDPGEPVEYTNADAVDGKITHRFEELQSNHDYQITINTTLPDQTGGSSEYEIEESIMVHTVNELFDLLNTVPYNFPWQNIPIPGIGTISVPDIDLTNAFDENHKALMDSLYVITNYFPTAMQHGSSPSMLLVFGRRTEYIYSLVDARNLPEYGYRKLTNLDGKKLYFRGTYDNLSTGEDEKGFDVDGFFTLVGRGTAIAGEAGDNVDIYLDNYQISTANKAVDFGSDTQNILFQNLMGGKVDIGRAAPFAIRSRGEYNGGQEYTVHFHLAGDNRLSTGSKTVLNAASSSGFSVGTLLAMFLDILDISAAGVYVSPDATTSNAASNIATTVTFDDKWPVDATDFTQIKRTNGSLDLSPKADGGREALSVDLGTRYGVCKFDGGKYKFTTAASSSVFFTSTFAIGYRYFAMTELLGAPLNVIGVGTSMGAPMYQNVSVFFNDGTFTTHSAEDFTSEVDVVAHGWYRDYTDLRVPESTVINGGTFNNCNVYFVSGAGEQGSEPSIEIENVMVPQCKKEKEVVSVNENGTADIDASVTGNEWASGYGSESLTPDGNNKVYPYLTGECEDITLETRRNWVTLIPKMGMQMENVMNLTMGGDTKVYEKESYNGTPRDVKNSFLFYAQLNPWTIANAKLEMVGIPVSVQQAIRYGTFGRGVAQPDHPGMTEAEFFSTLNANAIKYDQNDNPTNTDFTIEHGLYTMLSFEADRAYMICPPYDVHNVYVLETYSDAQAQADGVRLGSSAYLKKQGAADGELAKGIVTSLLPDVFSGKGSGVNLSLIEIATQTLGMTPYRLLHFDGGNGDDANYYLYEYKDMANDVSYKEDERDVFSDGSYFPGYPGLMPLSPSTYETDSLTKKFYQNQFDYVDPNLHPLGTYVDREGNVFQAHPLMQKGHIYSMFLPSEESAHYWKGKYLVFEGYGPQQVGGSGRHNDIQEASDIQESMSWLVEDYPEMNFNFEGLAKVQGNPTMVNYTTKEPSFTYKAMTSHAYDDGTDFSETEDAQKGFYYHDWVKQSAGVSIHPWETFLVMNTDNTNRYSAFSELYYEVFPQILSAVNRHNNQTTESSVPKISDFALSVGSKDSKIIMYAFVNQQVSIYTTTGMLVWTGSLNANDTKTITVPQGVYIVQGENDRTKIMVR